MINGDRMTGGFLGMNDQAIKLQIDGKPVEIDRTGVVAVGFDPAALSYPAAGELPRSLSGRRLAARRHRRKARERTDHRNHPLRPAHPNTITELVRIDPRTEAWPISPNGSRMPSRTSPISAQPGPFTSMRPLTAIAFNWAVMFTSAGWVTQSRTLLAYKLKPGDRRFQTTVGVDDRAGPLGSVVFRVLADGKPVVPRRRP